MLLPDFGFIPVYAGGKMRGIQKFFFPFSFICAIMGAISKKE
jgi:hypothetical protein